MKVLFLLAGFIFLGLGILGIYLPVMPAMLFFLLAAVCFSKGSRKFNDYFVSTKFYKANVEPIKNKSGMTLTEKIRILLIITIAIGFSIYMTNSLYARIAMLVVLVFYYLLFIFKVKTIEE